MGFLSPVNTAQVAFDPFDAECADRPPVDVDEAHGNERESSECRRFDGDWRSDRRELLDRAEDLRDRHRGERREREDRDDRLGREIELERDPRKSPL